MSNYSIKKSKKQIRKSARLDGELPHEVVRELMAGYQAKLREQDLIRRVRDLEHCVDYLFRELGVTEFGGSQL